MSKNITQLALKFSKLISLGEPTPEELDTITGKNVPQRVLISWDLKNKLSQLVDNWRNRAEVIAIKKAWQGLMANGVSSPDGVMVYGGGNLTPMLNALTALGTLAQDPKTGTPEVELGEIHDMYVAFSQLSTPKIPTPKTPVSNDNVIEPFNPKVKQVQEILNDLNYPYPLNPDGKLGPQTRLALKWFRTFRLGLNLLSDADTMNAVIQSNQSVVLPAPTDKSSTWGDTKELPPLPPPSASQLARRFSKIITATENPFDIIKRKKHYLLPAPLTSKDIDLLELLIEYPDKVGRSRSPDEEDYQPLIARGLVERLIEVHPTMGHNIYIYVITDAGLDVIDKYWAARRV
jgi:hypothetical protein